MKDSRVVDFVNTVRHLRSIYYCIRVLQYKSFTCSCHGTRCALFSTENWISKSLLLLPSVFTRWKPWRPGNSMLGVHTNCLIRKATGLLWSKNSHRYDFICWASCSFIILVDYWWLLFCLFFGQELGLGPSVPLHVVLQDWIRHADGKLSFLGFIKLLHGVSSRSIPKA